MNHQHRSFFSKNDELFECLDESSSMMYSVGEKDQNKINIKERGGVGRREGSYFK